MEYLYFVHENVPRVFEVVSPAYAPAPTPPVIAQLVAAFVMSCWGLQYAQPFLFCPSCIDLDFQALIVAITGPGGYDMYQLFNPLRRQTKRFLTELRCTAGCVF